jgi:transcription-repair coupling factor (superfamily II helicase)
MLSAVVMMGAVIVLLAGALGDRTSLPKLGAGLSTSVARILPGSTQDASQAAAPADPAPAVSYDAGTAQLAVDALNQQLAQLQQQVDQRDKELDAVRADENVEQQKLTALKQQRQSEEAAIAQLQAQHQQLASAQQAEASSASAQRLAANAALQKQSAELQAQIKQQFEQLVMLRTNQDQERHALDTLHLQRRAEEDAITRLQSQKEQMAAAATSAPVSPPQVTPAQAKRSAPVSHVTPVPTPTPTPVPTLAPTPAPTNDTMQSAVAQLRARQRDVPPSPPGPMAPMAAPARPPTFAADQPKLIVSTKGVLITARELVASGRLAEARDLLMKARADSALRPVTPDQPYATGATAVANQIGAAINFLDVGNSVRALDAINVAMDNVGTGVTYAPAYSATAATGRYPYSSYYDGEARR